jgi:hypothetical protein
MTLTDLTTLTSAEIQVDFDYHAESLKYAASIPGAVFDDGFSPVAHGHSPESAINRYVKAIRGRALRFPAVDAQGPRLTIPETLVSEAAEPALV